MGDLNGFEATRRLGADEATAAIPVIAVSASAWGEVRQAARDAGCVDFLPKPVKADVLFARLQRYTGARFVSPAAEPDAALPLEPLAATSACDDLAARIREAAAIGSVADLDAIAAELVDRRRRARHARPPHRGADRRLRLRRAAPARRVARPAAMTGHERSTSQG